MSLFNILVHINYVFLSVNISLFSFFLPHMDTRYIKLNPFAKISRSTFFKCFCCCNQTKQSVNECACPICTDMECELRALRELGAHSKKCDNDHCKKFKKSIKTTTAWIESNSCDRVAIPELQRVSSDEPFLLR